ncbi:MAG TPA: hypothetical protein ENK06_02780, partial [Gammaproteobacteria bacterium]|nr:hypothetical protein [Gammaproteobacteria bacterium]
AGQWKKFISYYRDRDGTKLRCYYARALYETSQIKKANEVTEALWMVGKSQPSACDSVFKIWEKKGGMTRARLWERVRLAMDKGQVSLAKFLASKMNKIDRNWVYHWRKMRKHPAENLLRKIYQVDAPIPNMIVRYGIKRLARRDIGAAADLWETIKTRHYKDTPQEAADVDQFLALRAAYQNHPRALEWLEKIPEPTAKVREWRIRAALSQQDWWAALHWIEALPEAERKSDQWQYWRARILALESKSLPTLRATSEKVYSRLSKERSYHGFMAADRSGGEYALHSDPLTFSKQELSAIENLPGIVRARELFFLGKLVDGRREWSKVTAPLNPIDLQKASLLASRWGWHDRAIFTVARASHFGDLELRFPMAHKEIVLSQAKKQGVEASWVYGVLRQESGFMADARSGAGALGLMQLMPGTSRLTARKLKFRIRSNMELLNVKKNIRLGVAYLRRMWDENEKNNILATASYNAGPYRIKKWLPKQDMPSDLWVETIPFEETRKYVQRVMAYTVIYDKKLTGKTGMMPYRMPLIKAKHDQES